MLFKQTLPKKHLKNKHFSQQSIKILLHHVFLYSMGTFHLIKFETSHFQFTQHVGVTAGTFFSLIVKRRTTKVTLFTDSTVSEQVMLNAPVV